MESVTTPGLRFDLDPDYLIILIWNCLILSQNPQATVTWGMDGMIQVPHTHTKAIQRLYAFDSSR